MAQQSAKIFRLALIIAFVMGAAFTAFYVVRAINAAIYWSQHKDDPIEGWMNIGFVAHSYHVPPHVLHQALGLPMHPPEKRSLSQIAKSRGVTTEQIAATLNEAIVRVRPPYPPPGPPPKRNSAKPELGN